MKTTRLTAALLLAAVGVLAAVPARAQDPVGRIALVRGDVRGTPPGGAAAAMAVADPVVLDHLIATGRASAARMTLEPEGVLSIGQETELRIDRGTVDQATGEGESVLTLLLGRLEVALGSLFRGEVTVETPSASLGVKGTVFRVLVDAAGRTLVAVLEGVVEVTSKATGETLVLEAGDYAIVEPGGLIVGPAPFDPAAGTLSPSAGGPDFHVPGEDAFEQTPLFPEEQRDLPREPPTDAELGPQGSQEPPPGGPDGP